MKLNTNPLNRHYLWKIVDGVIDNHLEVRRADCCLVEGKILFLKIWKYRSVNNWKCIFIHNQSLKIFAK